MLLISSVNMLNILSIIWCNEKKCQQVCIFKRQIKNCEDNLLSIDMIECYKYNTQYV